ncbi:MAG: hypothetical protein AAF850_03310 [Pseudomonadota bacterium]
MKHRRQFDLVVIGAEPCGLVAAACAAREGAACAIIETGLEAPLGPSAPAIPNFVWRRLDLHETALTVEPVSAYVSLFKNGDKFATYKNDRRTAEAVRSQDPGDGALWEDFVGEMRSHTERSLSFRDFLVDGETAGAAQTAHTPHLMTDAAMTDALVTVLNDYFQNDTLKAHLAAIAGAAFAIGGEEPGSRLAASSICGDDAWRIKNAQALSETLDHLCASLGVARIMSPIESIDRQDPRTFIIDLSDGDEVRTGALMASSSRIARAAGLQIDGDPSPIFADENVEAVVTFTLSSDAEPPAQDIAGDSAIYYIAENPDEVRAARDAVLEGRTPDNPPLVIEFAGREVVVRAPYCPRMLASDEGSREWTGQDRQLLGARVAQRLAEYLNGALDGIETTDVRLLHIAPDDLDRAPIETSSPIAAPEPDADEIGAAARLALKLVANG